MGPHEEGVLARQELAQAIAVLDEQATRFVEQRQEAAAKRAPRRA
jgi:acyl-[acyl-carrier-protein] desaturase